MKEQSEIEKNEDKDLKLEDVHYKQDSDCIAAGQFRLILFSSMIF